MKKRVIITKVRSTVMVCGMSGMAKACTRLVVLSTRAVSFIGNKMAGVMLTSIMLLLTL